MTRSCIVAGSVDVRLRPGVGGRAAVPRPDLTQASLGLYIPYVFSNKRLVAITQQATSESA